MRINYFNFNKIKSISLLCFISIASLSFNSCESTIRADYETIKAKNIILMNDDGAEYRLIVVRDINGNDRLDIEKLKK